MKHTEIAAVMQQIEDAGIPVTYWSWTEEEVPPLPYAIYLFTDTQPEAASDTIHAQLTTISIELYTITKDLSAEAIVDGILKANDIVFRKSSLFLQSESMVQTLYTFMEVLE